MPIFKPGVDHRNLSYHITGKYNDIDEVHQNIVGREAIITSGRDGRHMANSRHYSGLAIDLRTRDILFKAEELVEALKNKLGNNYDIILEYDHIHLEYDP